MSYSGFDEVLLKFFSLDTWSGLARFVDDLEGADPFQRALKYYAQTWVAPEGEEAFAPSSFLAKDCSAIFYGKCPVISEGSNHWAQKCYADPAEYDAKLDLIYARCARLRAAKPEAKICLVLVPEKDFVISAVLLKEDRFSAMTAAVGRLRNKLHPLGIQLVFDDAVDQMDKYQTLTDFEYPDSHLAPRNYVVIFSRALRAIGFDWDVVAPRVVTKPMDVYYDLSTKFRRPGQQALHLL